MWADLVAQAATIGPEGVLYLFAPDLMTVGYALCARKLGICGECRTWLLRIRLTWCGKHTSDKQCRLRKH